MRGLAVLVLWPAMAWAGDAPDSRAALVARIVAAGTHEHGDERLAAEVRDCALTTYRWRERGGEWRLWTVFLIDIGLTDLERGTAPLHLPYLAIRDADSGGGELGLVTFRTAKGAELRHEKPVEREANGKWRVEPSPREGGERFYYEFKLSGLVMLTGPGAIAKVQDFTAAYLEYRRRFCQIVG